ncbi:hypothetical protein Patl1_12105 [Pistacia atlantica]|uniref:Uncharacterized protein n=1 Tax=Pistacia atlantica TaxID=434234 RepID=A0ACC1AB03_9ROSI|nr:hypothetical protein Patl1_12105 [Pistacia atlantica]
MGYLDGSLCTFLLKFIFGNDLVPNPRLQEMAHADRILLTLPRMPLSPRNVWLKLLIALQLAMLGLPLKFHFLIVQRLESSD